MKMELPTAATLDESRIGDELTSNDIHWFSFKHKNDHLDYRRFRVKEVSFNAVLLLLIVSTTIQLFFAAISTTGSNSHADIAVRFLRVVSVLPGWAVVYYLFQHRDSHPYRLTLFSNLYTIFIVTSACVGLILRVINGKCGEDKKVHEQFDCNPEAEVHVMPQDSTFTLLLLLVVLEVVMKAVEWWAILISWVCCAATLIAGMAVVNTRSALAMPLLMVVVLCLLYEIECSYIRIYVVMHNNQLSMRASMRVEFQRQAVEQQAVEMRHLLGNVAHDMKTPVQSFMMDLEHLEKKIRDCKTTSVTQQQCAQEILDVVQNLNDTNVFMRMIINRAIDYTKCSSGTQLCPSMHSVDWYDQLHDIVKLVQTKSRVPITLLSLPSFISSQIVTDKQWLIDNALCLISNAVKFTMEGFVTVRCDIIQSAKCDTMDQLLIEVEDTGVGIPKEKQEIMFQPFQQTTRFAGGTGLGLYSMSMRMKALGGECGLRDRSDGKSGVCVWFKIPYVPAEMSSFPLPTPLSSNSSATSDENMCTIEHDNPICTESHIKHSVVLESKVMDALSAETPRGIMDRRTSRSTVQDEQTMRLSEEVFDEPKPAITILLVDDSPIIRKSVSRSLVNCGCIVELAENGEIGLQMMREKQYDLVLMDIQMPVMDGLEATKQLRAYESIHVSKHNAQRIVGISAYHGDEMGPCCIDCGMQGFIEKPFTQKQLVQCCYEFGIDCFQKHV